MVLSDTPAMEYVRERASERAGDLGVAGVQRDITRYRGRGGAAADEEDDEFRIDESEYTSMPLEGEPQSAEDEADEDQEDEEDELGTGPMGPATRRDYDLREYREDYNQVKRHVWDRVSRMAKAGGGEESGGGLSDAGFQLAQRIGNVVNVGQQLVSHLTQLYARNHMGAKFTPFMPGPGILDRPGVSKASEMARALVLPGGQMLNRLETLVNTDLQLAKTRTLYSAFDEDMNVNREPIKIWKRVPGGENPCALCEIAADQVYFSDDLMPIHDNCCLGGLSNVWVPSLHGGGTGKFGAVQAVTRRKFSGQAVQFSTASGNLVSVTPNHPILTSQGWLPAGLLRKGDTVFRPARSQGMVGGRPYEYQDPTPIEDVFHSARRKYGINSHGLIGMPIAAENFHGDNADGEVDIVWTDRNLAPIRNIKQASELCLMHAHSPGLAFSKQRTPATTFERAKLPTPRGMRGGSVGTALLRREPRITQPLSLTRAAKFDAPAQKFSRYSAATYASQGCALLDALAGKVEADSIIEHRFVSFTGHVYNLQTVNGYYVCNDTVCSNCQCDVEEDTGERLTPHQLKYHHIGFVEKVLATGEQKEVIQTLADEDAPPEAYHNLVKVQQHGELGPVLTWAGQEFKGPEDLPTPASPRGLPRLPGAGAEHEARIDENRARVEQYRRQHFWPTGIRPEPRYAPGAGAGTSHIPWQPEAVPKPKAVVPEARPRPAPVKAKKPIDLGTVTVTPTPEELERLKPKVPGVPMGYAEHEGQPGRFHYKVTTPDGETMQTATGTLNGKSAVFKQLPSGQWEVLGVYPNDSTLNQAVRRFKSIMPHDRIGVGEAEPDLEQAAQARALAQAGQATRLQPMRAGYEAVLQKGWENADLHENLDYMAYKWPTQVGEWVGFVNPIKPTEIDPRINETAARNILQALDEMLTKYPDVRIGKFGIGTLEEGTIGETCTALGTPGRSESLIMGRSYMSKAPGHFAAIVKAREDEGFYFPGAGEQPYRSSVYHEFGHVLDARGGWAARVSADNDLLDLFAKSPEALAGVMIWDRDHPGVPMPLEHQLDILGLWMQRGKQVCGYSMKDYVVPGAKSADGTLLLSPLTNKLPRPQIQPAEALAMAFDQAERHAAGLTAAAPSDLSKVLHQRLTSEAVKAYPTYYMKPERVAQLPVDRLRAVREKPTDEVTLYHRTSDEAAGKILAEQRLTHHPGEAGVITTTALREVVPKAEIQAAADDIKARAEIEQARIERAKGLARKEAGVLGKPDAEEARTRAAMDPKRIQANREQLFREITPEVKAQGIAWYPDASETLWQMWQDTGRAGLAEDDFIYRKVMALGAAFSPQEPWELNREDVRIFLNSVGLSRHDRDEAVFARPGGLSYSKNIERAERVWAARTDEEIGLALRGTGPTGSHYYDNGPKITNFWRNLLGHKGNLTLDTWEASASRMSPDERRALLNEYTRTHPKAKVNGQLRHMYGPGERVVGYKEAGLADKMADEANAKAAAEGKPLPYMPTPSLMVEHGYDIMESAVRQAIAAQSEMETSEFQASSWVWLRGGAT